MVLLSLEREERPSEAIAVGGGDVFFCPSFTAEPSRSLERTRALKRRPRTLRREREGERERERKKGQPPRSSKKSKSEERGVVVPFPYVFSFFVL